jgi:hypothetical protein
VRLSAHPEFGWRARHVLWPAESGYDPEKKKHLQKKLD